MRKESFSNFALTLLGKLAAGRRLRLLPAGGGSLGGRPVAQSVLDQLLAAELVRYEGEDVRLTESGHARARRLVPTPVPLTGEKVDGYRAQHMHVSRTPRRSGEAAAPMALCNQAESPLGWLARRRDKNGVPLLSRRQVVAGERLREDFERAGMGQRLTRAPDALPVDRGRRGGAPAREESVGALDARRRLHRALDTVGPGLSDMLMRICCFLEGLEEAERAMAWPARSGKVVLALALDRLADHYDGKKTGASERPSFREVPSKTSFRV